jgi:multidrug efflux pump subunit AcrA (membrane-fusion protein)
MNEKKRSKKWYWIGGAVGLLMISAIALLVIVRNGSAAEENGTGEIVTAFTGDLSTSATASGQIGAQREAALSLSSAGQVAEVSVEVGDTVQADDPLLNLDMAEIERAVVSAEQSLAIQEANLATLLAPATDADITAAGASVASAQASLQDLLDGPNEDEIAAAEADVRAASADVYATTSQLADLRDSASEEEIRGANRVGSGSNGSNSGSRMAQHNSGNGTRPVYQRKSHCGYGVCGKGGGRAGKCQFSGRARGV